METSEVPNPVDEDSASDEQYDLHDDNRSKSSSDDDGPNDSATLIPTSDVSSSDSSSLCSNLVTRHIE